MAADEEEGNNSNTGSYCTNLKMQWDELVSSFGDIDRIKEQMSDPKWLNDFKS